MNVDAFFHVNAWATIERCVIVIVIMKEDFHAINICVYRKQAQAAKMEAEKEGIVVPVTLEDYCIKTRARPAEQQLDMTDFYDDEYELDDDEDEQLSASDYEDGDDSGNGES